MENQELEDKYYKSKEKNKKDRTIITILLILITIQTIILFGHLLLPYGYR